MVPLPSSPHLSLVKISLSDPLPNHDTSVWKQGKTYTQVLRGGMDEKRFDRVKRRHLLTLTLPRTGRSPSHYV